MSTINDILYGNFKIPSLFSALLETPTLKRLARVHQSGAVFLVNEKIKHHRLEHSIGVMLLIRKLGGSELEQIAGLLHDLSHTAFSHVGDYIMGNDDESYHEQLFQERLLNSEIPSLLAQYGYQVADIIQRDFSILEQPLPYLCADRVDYTLRDAFHFGLISRKAALDFVAQLELNENKIILKNEEQAAWITELSKQLNDDIYQHPRYVFVNTQLAALIKDLLNQGLLTQQDLFQDDTFLLNKIRSNLKGLLAIREIKALKAYPKFLRNPHIPAIKKRYLQVSAYT